MMVSSKKSGRKSDAKKRDYKKEYMQYHGKPAQIKRRAQRNTSRRKLMVVRRVKKGDGKDVHHKDHNPANQRLSNLRVRKKSANRSDNQKSKKK